MIVAPDAGPLIYLAGAGQLELLRQLYHRVVVPRVVFDEVCGQEACRRSTPFGGPSGDQAGDGRDYAATATYPRPCARARVWLPV